MSYVKSNQNLFSGYARDYTVDELERMTVEQFDALPLSDQVSIYNNHRDAYDRLTGRTAPIAKDNRTDEQRFADEFEERIDTILRKNFHPNEA